MGDTDTHVTPLKACVLLKYALQIPVESFIRIGKEYLEC